MFRHSCQVEINRVMHTVQNVRNPSKSGEKRNMGQNVPVTAIRKKQCGAESVKCKGSLPWEKNLVRHVEQMHAILDQRNPVIWGILNKRVQFLLEIKIHGKKK